jgi:hypothetical protein
MDSLPVNLILFTDVPHLLVYIFFSQSKENNTRCSIKTSRVPQGNYVKECKGLRKGVVSSLGSALVSSFAARGEDMCIEIRNNDLRLDLIISGKP